MSISLPFFVVMSIATAMDFLTKRISNYLILSGLILGFSLALVNGGLESFGNALLGSLVGLAVFLYPYTKSVMGAGDVKLMAVVGSFLGPYLTLLAALYTSIFGGILILIYLAYKGLVSETFNNLFQFKVSTSRVPYAFAISLGSGFALLNPTFL